MPPKDDWFRSGDWDQPAQDLFEVRLARSRPAGRPRHLRIKALGLKDAGRTEAARVLLHRVLDDHPDNWVEVRSATEHLADLARDAGRTEEAISLYLRVLDSPGHDRLSGTSGEPHLSLARIHVDRGDPDAALRALDYVAVGDLGTNTSVFRWNALLADISSALGEPDVSRDAARRALDLVDAPDQFARHPGVGRAVAEPAVLQHLRELERGEPLRRRRFWRKR